MDFAPITAEGREKLIAAYTRWATAHRPEDEWAVAAMHDHIWRHTEPEEMIEVVVQVINQLRGNASALGYVGAGPLEDLLGGRETVMQRAADEAVVNPDFRASMAGVYGVKYNLPGFERLHELASAEIAALPPPRRRKPEDVK